MTRQRFIYALVLWAVLPAALLSAAYQADNPNSLPTNTVVLYDGSMGTTPDQQGFTFLVFGSAAGQQYVDGATVLDTTADSNEQAGYFNREALPLDRGLGYKARFTLRIEEENHLSPHRAGFSLIILSDDLLGLEIAFWEDEIWVQEGGTGSTLFTHAEGVPFNTTSALITYELSVLEDAYTLFEGFPDVYETPGLLFLGDNTTRGAAKTAVSHVALEVSSEATPMPTATATATAIATATATSTPQPTATATPKPADKLYFWLPCLKGVDDNTQK